MPTPYRLESERLLLRCWEPEDAPALHQAVQGSLSHILPWVPWARREPLSLAERFQSCRRYRGRFDLDVDFSFGVWLRESGALLGGAGLHTRRGPESLEVGYWVHVDHCGRGYATEMTALLTHVAFRFWPVRRVELHMNPRNAASARIPEKLGFTHETTRRGNYRPVDGPVSDTAVWTLLRTELESNSAYALPYRAFDVDGDELGDRAILTP